MYRNELSNIENKNFFDYMITRDEILMKKASMGYSFDEAMISIIEAKKKKEIEELKERYKIKDEKTVEEMTTEFKQSMSTGKEQYEKFKKDRELAEKNISILDRRPYE